MSSDNYLYVRRYRGRFVVTDESASLPQPGPVRGNHSATFHDTLADAIDYASGEYSEYGMRLQKGLSLANEHPLR